MTNASLPRRFGAMLYDSLLMLALLFAATVPLVALRDDQPVEPGNVLYRVLLVGVTYGFLVGFWYRYGRTLGMQSWGLRIESAQGGRPSLAQCSLRFVAAILSWLPFGLGYFWQLVDRDGLSWHDRLSGTRLRYYPRERDDT
jgi:uncharacterized RDD family membrane protein YckC